MSGSVPTSRPGPRIVFLGTPEPAVRVLEAVLAAGFPVSLVVTRPDRPRGRGLDTSASPVKCAALSAGLPVFEPEDVNSDASVERVRAEAPDLLLIVAYGRILKKGLRAVPRLLPLNVHFSLLPEYRGAAPVARAIADGKTITGVTLQRIVRKLDAGPVLAAEEVPIGPDETAAELADRLAAVGAELTVRTLDRLGRGETGETPQDESRATLAPMLSKEEGEVDWSRSAHALHCHVRAMDPWPGARSVYRSAARGDAVEVLLLRSRPGPPGDRAGPPPGTVLRADAEGLLVQTGDGGLLVTELKPAGKRALTAREFVNGYRAASGDILSR
ncbi:MAG: methionyl-tRNA formyltransferase [Planctomycetes bacterium]|nr:methionyl-tRNA formyltransferase [Planctomycetota bacterium]